MTRWTNLGKQNWRWHPLPLSLPSPPPLPVCRSKKPPCVDSKRPRVYRHHARMCQNNRERETRKERKRVDEKRPEKKRRSEMKEKTREEEKTGQKMEDKRRSERRLEERRNRTLQQFRIFKITITDPESILNFPVISYSCDCKLKLFSNYLGNHFGQHGMSLAVAELGVNLERRGRDFGELTNFVLEDIKVAGRLHDDLKVKVLHVDQQVMHLVEWSNGITTTLNDVEGRVDNLEQWGEELAQSLRGSTARPGRDTNTGHRVESLCTCSISSSSFLFMNPGVLQFINRRVDIPAACRSWYAQCTLCRPCSGDGCAPVVVQRQVPWLGRAENCGVPQLPFLWGCAMLGSTRDTCSVSSRVAFGWIFYDFLRDWEDSAPEVILVVHCTHGRWGSCRARRQQWQWLAFTGFAYDAPRAVFPMIAGSLPIDTSVARELHLEICTLFLRASCIFSIFHSRNFALVDFSGPSSTHSCECSRAGGAGVAGSLLPGDSAPGCAN